MPQAVDCEAIGAGFWGQPVNTATSFAFLVAAVAIAAAPGGRLITKGWWAGLVAAVGMGSIAFHGPHPPWAEWLHDVAIIAVLIAVAADAGGRTGRGPDSLTLRWTGPALALPAIAVALVPATGDILAVVVAVVAVAAVVAATRLGTHRLPPAAVWAALLLLAVGATVGTLSRAGWPWCRPDSLWQGHAVWHLLAAAALAVYGRATLRTAPYRAMRS